MFMSSHIYVSLIDLSILFLKGDIMVNHLHLTEVLVWTYFLVGDQIKSSRLLQYRFFSLILHKGFLIRLGGTMMPRVIVG